MSPAESNLAPGVVPNIVYTIETLQVTDRDSRDHAYSCHS